MPKSEFLPYPYVTTKSFVEQNKVECSLNLSEEYFDKVLSITGNVAADKASFDNGEIVYGGLVSFNAVFKADEAERAEAGTKFSFKKPCQAKDDTEITIDYRLEQISLKKEGGMIYAVALLTAAIAIKEKEELAVVSDIDCLCKKEAVEIVSPLLAKGVFELDDEFEAVKLKRVLASRLSAVCLTATAAVDAVICDGELVLSIAMLPFSENSDIIKETRTIPFRLEVDCQGASPEMSAYMRVNPTKLNLKVYIDEDNGKSTVQAEMGIALEGAAVKKEEGIWVFDACSPTCELNFEKVELCYSSVEGCQAVNEKAFGKAACNVPEYSRFVEIICERCEIAGYKLENGQITVDGLVVGDALFISGENELVSEKAELPFSVSFLSDAEEITSLNVIPEKASAKLRSGNLEIEAILKISYLKVCKKCVSLVCSIQEGEPKAEQTAALSVYLASEGDTEWSVSKQLGVDIDAVYATNPQLEFPLKGNEKIILYRQK